ncbi:gp436 family protein [Chroococcidiopsis sp.]|uniref:gp436 family protein n=1 Tax=Chroococcidiopsis sp. TaxID=3088168 RepID=UPI003F3F2A1B
MSYATVEDFISYFGQQESLELSNLNDPMATEVNLPLLQQHLNYATAEINGYIAGNYNLPLPTIPQILIYHTCDVARYRMDIYKSREDVVDRYERAIAYLRDVSRGIVNLGLDQNNVEVETVALEPAYFSALPVFTIDSLRDF